MLILKILAVVIVIILVILCILYRKLKTTVRKNQYLDIKIREIENNILTIKNIIDKIEKDIKYIYQKKESKENIKTIDKLIKNWLFFEPLLKLGNVTEPALQHILKIKNLYVRAKNGAKNALLELKNIGEPGIDFIRRLWHSNLSNNQREWLIKNLFEKKGYSIYQISIGTSFEPSMMIKVGTKRKGFPPGTVVNVINPPIIDSDGNCIVKAQVILEG